MGNGLRFHHIGIATRDIEQTKEYVKDLFEVVDITETIYDEKQDAYLCMIIVVDGTKIELISGEQVKGFVAKRRYLYHTCYETDNIEESIKKFQEKGDMIISEPKEAILFDNKKVAFVMTPLGMIELVEA